MVLAYYYVFVVPGFVIGQALFYPEGFTEAYGAVKAAPVVVNISRGSVTTPVPGMGMVNPATTIANAAKPKGVAGKSVLTRVRDNPLARDWYWELPFSSISALQAIHPWEYAGLHLTQDPGS